MHTLVARLYRAFEKFFDFDKNLLTLGEHGVHEQTVTARLAIYLQSEFPRNDVDCEYNRYEEKKKIFIKENKTFRPDIIVHQRGSGCKNNLIVIEAKKENDWEKDGDDLIKRLCIMTHQRSSESDQGGDYIFNYRLGLCWIIAQSEDPSRHNFLWFYNGEIIKKTTATRFLDQFDNIFY